MSAEVKIEVEGSTVSYCITGTFGAVTDAIGMVHASYPTPGYGTWFNWPPGKTYESGERKGEPNSYLAPKQIDGDLWQARGSRGSSCD